MSVDRYTAAAAILEQILTLAAKPAQRVKAELTALHYDIVMSLALIHEVDMLVQTRLDLYRLSSGRYDTRQNTQTVGCFALLQSRVNAAGALANKGVSFDFTLPDTSGTGREFCIQVDTYVWAHIAQNFLSNARKHTLEGSVSLHFLGEFDGMLHFAVVDTGFGIPPHVATQLFREEVTTGTERGVGLGLVSCQKFAQAIGGDCWLHSTKVRTAESAGGTEFRFCLPGCIVASNSNAKEAGHVDVAAISSISDVFVVEDSCLIRKTIITKLKHAAKAADCSWRFHEHATVESVLPSVPHFAGRADVIITVDQNLDSAGGCLKGSDLIRTLQVHSFNGIVISATGDATLANQHIELGADLAWYVLALFARLYYPFAQGQAASQQQTCSARPGASVRRKTIKAHTLRVNTIFVVTGRAEPGTIRKVLCRKLPASEASLCLSVSSMHHGGSTFVLCFASLLCLSCERARACLHAITRTRTRATARIAGLFTMLRET